VIKRVPYVDGSIFDIRMRGADLWLAGSRRRVGSKTVGGLVHLRIR